MKSRLLPLNVMFDIFILPSWLLVHLCHFDFSHPTVCGAGVFFLTAPFPDHNLLIHFDEKKKKNYTTTDLDFNPDVHVTVLTYIGLK